MYLGADCFTYAFKPRSFFFILATDAFGIFNLSAATLTDVENRVKSIFDKTPCQKLIYPIYISRYRHCPISSRNLIKTSLTRLFVTS